MLFILAGLFGRRGPGLTEPAALDSCSDEQLMTRYAAGEVEAFELLLGRHEARVLNFIYRSVGDRHRAEDLTQEVFLKVVRNAARYKESAKFTTWLFTIVRNQCIDESRRARHRRVASLDARIGDEHGATLGDRVHDAAAIGPVATMAREDFRKHLSSALAELPDEQREVFLLRHFEGMRFVEVGRMLGISENTVKSRMRYALTALRRHLADFEGFSFDDTESDEVASERR